MCRLRRYRAAMIAHWLRCTLGVGGAVGLRVSIMPIRVPIMQIRVPIMQIRVPIMAIRVPMMPIRVPMMQIRVLIMPIRVPTDDDGPPAVPHT